MASSEHVDVDDTSKHFKPISFIGWILVHDKKQRENLSGPPLSLSHSRSNGHFTLISQPCEMNESLSQYNNEQSNCFSLSASCKLPWTCTRVDLLLRLFRRVILAMSLEKGVDFERVAADKHLVAEELLCAICQGLLWKPHSCASCQHLFCRGCIETWRTVNPNSCPYRCTPYEDKRAPPSIQSLLSRLSIRCRNASLGCEEILLYNALEQHEAVACKFLTKTCPVCGVNIVVDEFDEHQRACEPPTRHCFLCKTMIDRYVFVEHLKSCFQQQANLLIDDFVPPLEPNEAPNAQHENVFLRLMARFQHFLTTLPRDNLIGIDDVTQAQQQSLWRRLRAMIRLLSFNRSKAPQLIIRLFFGGIGFSFGLLAVLWFLLNAQVRASAQRGFVLIILLSGLLCFGLPIVLPSISDTWIMLITTLLFVPSTVVVPIIPLDCLWVSSDDRIMYVLGLVVIFLFKLCLLILRATIQCIPSYLSAGCLAWILIFATFHIRHLRIHQA